MTFKVNSLNPFDKAFFGKTMQAYANRNSGEILNPTKLELSSIDDLNHYFSKKIITERLERAPKADVFKPEAKIEAEPNFYLPNAIC